MVKSARIKVWNLLELLLYDHVMSIRLFFCNSLPMDVVILVNSFMVIISSLAINIVDLDI